MFWNEIEAKDASHCEGTPTSSDPSSSDPSSPELLKQLSGPLLGYLLYQLWTQVGHMELVFGNSENTASTTLCVCSLRKWPASYALILSFAHCQHSVNTSCCLNTDLLLVVLSRHQGLDKWVS